MLQVHGASIYRRFILPLLPVEGVLMDWGFHDFMLFNQLQYSSTFSMGKTRRGISFLFAVVQGCEGYDWLFAANIN